MIAKQKILIVDDDENIAELISLFWWISWKNHMKIGRAHV